MNYEQKPKGKIVQSRCPKCGSTHVDTYRMPTGAIWCGDCGYRVEHKESDDSFYVRSDDPVQR